MKLHSARIADQDGLRLLLLLLLLLLESARAETPRLSLSHLWVDAGYRGRGKEWAESSFGLSVEVVHRSPKPPPEKVLLAWARKWSKEGRNIDLVHDQSTFRGMVRCS